MGSSRLQGESIIYFAKEWGDHRTSCDHVFHQLSRENKVLWVNSVAMRKPTLRSGRDLRKIVAKLRSFFGGRRQVGPSAWVYQPLVLPLPHSPFAVAINRAILRRSIRRQARKLGMVQPQLWSFLPNVGYMVGALGESLVVYYCIDEWSTFSYLDGQKMATMERELLGKADLCFATAQALVESKRRFNSNTVYASHGVDYDHFATALDPSTEVPADIRGLPGPVIGFFGLLQDWIDLELIATVARAHPEWSIALIGPADVDLGPLANQSNVHALGRRPYAELPAYCKAFSVGIIPFVVGELSRNVNPIKLREYLSAGLPVVSTDLPEVRQYEPLASVATSPEEFVAKIELALAEDSIDRRRERSEAMRGETWEARVERVGAEVMRIKAARERRDGS